MATRIKRFQQLGRNGLVRTGIVVVAYCFFLSPSTSGAGSLNKMFDETIIERELIGIVRSLDSAGEFEIIESWKPGPSPGQSVRIDGLPSAVPAGQDFIVFAAKLDYLECNPPGECFTLSETNADYVILSPKTKELEKSAQAVRNNQLGALRFRSREQLESLENLRDAVTRFAALAPEEQERRMIVERLIPLKESLKDRPLSDSTTDQFSPLAAIVRDKRHLGLQNDLRSWEEVVHVHEILDLIDTVKDCRSLVRRLLPLTKDFSDLNTPLESPPDRVSQVLSQVGASCTFDEVRQFSRAGAAKRTPNRMRCLLRETAARACRIPWPLQEMGLVLGDGREILFPALFVGLGKFLSGLEEDSTLRRTNPACSPTGEISAWRWSGGGLEEYGEVPP